MTLIAEAKRIGAVTQYAQLMDQFNSLKDQAVTLLGQLDGLTVGESAEALGKEGVAEVQAMSDMIRTAFKSAGLVVE